LSDKFSKVPVDDDTAILFRAEVKFGDFDVLYEKWCWEGIAAESIIFVSEDVATMTDAAIEMEVRTSPLVNSNARITLKRIDSGFTFVNFNFTTADDAETYTEPEPLTPKEKKQRKKEASDWIGEKNRDEIERLGGKKN